MLTVGYGDIVAITNIEKLYTIMTMLIGCCLFAYIMNSIGTLVDQIKNKDAAFRDEL
jgi:hyperpolarization activated cyclic nucleotide-gated potassium channel 2